MKPVHLFTASEIGMRNAWDINLKVKPFYFFKWHFLDFKAPLTDSQNRILDSKPMSMREFSFLLVSINRENLNNV